MLQATEGISISLHSPPPPSSSSAQVNTKSIGDGLLANLQERLVETESGFSILSSHSGNTDLRTLADLATMGDKALLSSHGSAALMGDVRGADGMDNGGGEVGSPRVSIEEGEDISAQESIAKAFNRLVDLQGYIFFLAN